MSPVVGKALESTIIVLYIALITAALYGGTVPEYRAAAGSEIADRTMADVAIEIQRSIPPESTDADIKKQMSLPPTIAGEHYRIKANERRLTLTHPHPQIETQIPLVISDRVISVEGEWQSGGQLSITVLTTDAGLVVRLQ